MYENIVIVMGSWHTKKFDPESTINALAARRFTPTRDIPLPDVMPNFFDDIVTEFMKDLEHCNLDRQKTLNSNGYSAKNFVRVSHLELYTFEQSNAPHLAELGRVYWEDCIDGFPPVNHLRFDRMVGHSVSELRQAHA